MTHPLGLRCSPRESTHGGTYGWGWVVCVVVKVDGDVVCSAWMVLHGMAQRMMYHSNQLWYVQVHGMALVHGTGRGGCWCYTLVVTGGHSHHGTVRSSMTLHSSYMQVHSGPLGGAPRWPWGMENPSGYNWCWLGTTVQCLLVVLVDMEDNTHNTLMMGVYGGHCGRTLWHIWEAVRTIRMPLLKGWPRRVACV